MNALKKIRSNTYAMYTLLFIIIAFFSFFWFIIIGKTFIYNWDGYLQYYSFLVKLRRFVADIFHGNGISLWSWDAGYGSDTLGNFAIVFCDPFSYIAAAFKPKYIDIGYTISVILRLYAAGTAMIAFLRYRGKNFLQCIIGGTAYAFSAWAINATIHVFFLNPLVFFPLIILGVDKIDKEKKPFIFVAAVFLSLITSFYFSYMSALLTVAYIIIKYLFENESKKSIADFFKRFIKFVFYAVLAVFIAAPVLIPVLYTLINATKTTGIEFNAFFNLTEFLRYILSFISNIEISTNYSYTTLSMICLAMVPAAIIDFKNKFNRFPSLMALICVIMAAFPIFGCLFNALSYPVGRWCYMLAFFFVWASVSALDLDKFKDTEYKRQYKTILTVIEIIFAVTLIAARMIFNILSDETTFIGLINLTFLIIFGYIVCSNDKDRRLSKSATLIIFVAANLGLMYFVQYSPNLQKLGIYTDVGQSYERYSSSSQRVGTAIDDNNFYRIDQIQNSITYGYDLTSLRVPANDNLFFGTRSIYSYISTIDHRIFDYNKALCNSAGYHRRICFNSNDNRSRINFLQGVRYFIGDDLGNNSEYSQYAGYKYKSYKTTDGVEILKNKYKASLGYVFENTISNNDFMKYGYLDREQIMMQACVVSDDNKTNASKIKENEIALETQNVDYEIDSESGLSFSKGKIKVFSDDSRLIINAGAIKNSELYVVIKNLKRKPFSYQEFKNYCLDENADSKLESYRFNARNVSFSPNSDFNIFVLKPYHIKRLMNAEGENQAFTDVKDYTANLGYYKYTSGKICIDFNTIGDYTYDSIEVVAVSQENYDTQAKTLQKNRLKVSTLHDNYIKGKVNAENDGLLYLNIPYNDGWKVYIDGKEQETFVADIAFTGVDIDKGKHTVELIYRPVGFKAGLLMSITGIIVLAVILIYKRMKRKIK